MLLKNIVFSFEQIFEKKFLLFFRMIQITLSLAFLVIVLNYVVSYIEMKEQIDHLNTDGEIYVFRDYSNLSPRVYELKDARYQSCYEEILSSIDSSGLEQVVCNNSFGTHIGSKQIDVISVSSNFFEKYHIKGNFSKESIENYFAESYFNMNHWISQTKHAIVGSSYAKKYKIGDRLVTNNGTFYIEGFLDQGSYYSLPTQSNEVQSLDKAILVNVNVDYSDIVSMRDRIVYTMFFTHSEEELKKLQLINESIAESGIMDYYMENYHSQMAYVKNTVEQIIILEGSIGCALLVFSLISFICMMIQLINEHKHEYAINMICGAKKSDIYFRVVLQPIFMLLTGAIIAAMFVRYSQVYRIIGGIFILCSAFVMIYGYFCLNKNSIYENLRKG